MLYILTSNPKLETLSHEHRGIIVLGGIADETKVDPGTIRSQVIPLLMNGCESF